MKALIIPFPTFNSMELLSTIRVLKAREVAFEVYSTELIVTSEDYTKAFKVHGLLEDVRPENYDILLLTSGAPAHRKEFWFSEVLHEIVIAFKDKPIGAICAAVGALAPIVRGYSVSCWPLLPLESILKVNGANVRDSSLTVDRNLVTAQTPQMTTYWAEAVLRIANGETVESLQDYNMGLRHKRFRLPWESKDDYYQ